MGTVDTKVGGVVPHTCKYTTHPRCLCFWLGQPTPIYNHYGSIHAVIFTRKAALNKYPLSCPPPLSTRLEAELSRYFYNDVTDLVYVHLLSLYGHVFWKWRLCCCVLIYNWCCSKCCLPWTILELGGDHMSRCEFYHHITTSRNILPEDSVRFLELIPSGT